METNLESRLWLTEESMARVIEGLSRPPLSRLVETARSIATPEIGSFFEAEGVEASGNKRQLIHRFFSAHALLGLIEDDPARGPAMLEGMRLLLPYDHQSDLGRAMAGMALLTGWDFGRRFWSKEERQEVAEGLRDFAFGFDNIHEGNPDNPFNNWWGVTHSTGGLCSLALLEYFPECAAQLDRQKERIRTYLLNYGDRGYYYEGTGYGNYAMSHWGPFVLAVRNVQGEDLADLSPGIAHLPETTSAMTLGAPLRSDSDLEMPEADRGMRVFWNDDGGQAAGAGLYGLYFALAPKEKVRALKGFFDRLKGEAGDDSWVRRDQFSIWTALFYPWDQIAQEPAGALAERILDRLTGMIIWRNRYQDNDDAVLGIYGKTYHGGGHWHNDAGSFRLGAFQGFWSQAGGQAKGGPEYQSCLLLNERISPEEQGKSGELGKISYYAPSPEGGSVSLSLRSAYRAKRVDRHFAADFSGRVGAPVLVALYDRLWNETDDLWSWTLCFERRLHLEARPDWNGFRLEDEDTGYSLAARFGQPTQVTVQECEGPATKRTFSTGGTRHYPGARYVRIDQTGFEQVDFFVILTVQQGDPPPVQFAGEGLEATAELAGHTVRLHHQRWFEGPLRIEPTA